MSNGGKKKEFGELDEKYGSGNHDCHQKASIEDREIGRSEAFAEKMEEKKK